MNQGGGFETLMVGPMGISVVLAKIKIEQGVKSQGYCLTNMFHVA